MESSPAFMEQDHYELSDSFILQKAEQAEWELYGSVYYLQTCTPAMHKLDCGCGNGYAYFWIYQESNRIGGVRLARNAMRMLYFIPPFRERGHVVRLLKKVLLKYADGLQPVCVYDVRTDQAELFSRAGFVPEAPYCRWMIRPTEIFPAIGHERYSISQPLPDQNKRQYGEKQMALFLHKCFAGQPADARGREEKYQQYISKLNKYAERNCDDMLQASCLVYDRQTHALVGVCLVGLKGDFPVLFTIAVLPEYRNRGLATLMLQRALTRLRERDYPVFLLNVNQGNRLESVCHALGFAARPLEISRMTLYI